MKWTKPPARQRQYGGEGAKPRTQLGEMAHRAQALRIETTVKLCVPLPKHTYLHSEPYRRWVASLDCAHCGRAGPSQCAHADEGKGLALKTSDETVFPACADAPGRQGCHTLIGATGSFTRDHRRELETNYAQQTRETAQLTGHWPKEWR